MALEAKFVWRHGTKVWVEHQPMTEARLRDYLLTQEHKTIKKLEPGSWGGDGAAS